MGDVLFDGRWRFQVLDTSHPPVAYDFDGAPTQSTPLIPGAAMTFPIFFSVPQETRVEDLVVTLRTNGDSDSSYKDVRVSLTSDTP